MKFFKHLSTVIRHRREVRRNCFKVGLIRQGLFHDLSKFSPSEFWAGVKYFQGTRSPQAKEREIFGYSAAWLHHKGRNKHHYEYWVDGDRDGNPVYVKMPPKYFAEMICDRVAASKIYKGKSYTDSSPLEYFLSRKDKAAMNEETARDLGYFLTLLSEKGEKAMFSELKAFLKNAKREAKEKKKSDKEA